MNKTAIKNFAIWARNKLIADIQYRAGLMGITTEGIKAALPQSTAALEFYDIGTAEPYSISGDAIRQRDRLVEIIRQKEKESDYPTAYKYILEEVAYTWFNRLIAIRFMEVNDYLPSHIRVLSSESGKVEPDLVTTPFDAGLDFSPAEEEAILRLKTDNQLDELFRLLFVKQCNALSEILPALFEPTSDYTELLLNLSVVDQEGVVYRLAHDIDEDDFNVEQGGQVEIIGWLYQYYNTEPKNAAFAKNGKITKEEIPAVTQLFTPDWIVRYMVENSLGRLWLERNAANSLGDDDEVPGDLNEWLLLKWKYYIFDAQQSSEAEAQLAAIRARRRELNPQDIHLIDPCMGSGHILVYAFEVLMQIYESQGWSQRDAAQSILEHNLYGLDIDDRAAQLAYFAVMMKARQYDRRILTRGIQPNLYAPHGYADGQEYGSLLTVDELEPKPEPPEELTLFDGNYGEKLNAWNFRRLLAQQYDVVVTNPPYMAVSNGNATLNKFVKDNYPDSKGDLFACFMERCGRFTKKDGYQAMITQHSWMFLSSFEKLRTKLLQSVDIVNMAHLGPRAFEEIGGEVVQTTSFVLRRSYIQGYQGTYCRLIEPTTQQGKEEMFLAGENRYTAQQSNFSKIPGAPVAYWASNQVIWDYMVGQPMDTYASPKQGSTLGDNDRFLRLWYEIASKPEKWLPCLKGGDYRKWYGNHSYLINWQNEGAEIKSTGRATIRNASNLFTQGISWSRITTHPSFRIMGKGYFFESASGVCFPPESKIEYVLGMLNSCVVRAFSEIVNPTLTLQSGDVATIPIIEDKIDNVSKVVDSLVEISMGDWDSYETSWDFKRHPLVELRHSVSKVNCPDSWYLKDAFEAWEYQCRLRFDSLKANEEELNRIFIGIYGLQDELTPDVADKDVTVHRIFHTKDDVPESMRGSAYVRTLRDEIVSLLSYAVGCMFGRYSLDVEGPAYAGGDWDDSKYKTFLPDTDNVIPITDEEYLEDDIVTCLCGWVKAVYGADTLEENLDFIARALGSKGDSSREIIRNYFLKDFFKDHCKTYQKRPIYWLFDSGKQNGFKALIYLHRYTPDTIGILRVDYLHKMQRVYESEINRMQDMIDNSKNPREVAASTKRKEKLQKQLKECREYDEMIGHLALSRIQLDLDDGVKVNYEKVQTASDGKKYPVLAKI